MRIFTNLNIFYSGPETEGKREIDADVDRVMGEDFGFQRLELEHGKPWQVWGAMDGFGDEASGYFREVITHFTNLAAADPSRKVMIIGDDDGDEPDEFIVLLNQGFTEEETRVFG